LRNPQSLCIYNHDKRGEEDCSDGAGNEGPEKREQMIQTMREQLLEGLTTTEELRDILGYSHIKSIYDLCDQGLPYLKAGYRRLYNMTKVREWLMSREGNGKKKRPVGRPRGSHNRPRAAVIARQTLKG
jgi:hypothetical protein